MNLIAVEYFLTKLITYNLTTEEGLTFNEEIETGIWAFRWIIKNYFTKINLYIEYLKSIDLDHTVEQPNMIEEIHTYLPKEELEKLINFLEQSGGQVFKDYIKDGPLFGPF